MFEKNWKLTSPRNELRFQANKLHYFAYKIFCICHNILSLYFLANQLTILYQKPLVFNICLGPSVEFGQGGPYIEDKDSNLGKSSAQEFCFNKSIFVS